VNCIKGDVPVIRKFLFGLFVVAALTAAAAAAVALTPANAFACVPGVDC
jgi:hypothetical protein